MRRIILVSGGFAIVQPNSQLSINAVEAFALEEFSAEAVRAQLAESQKVAAGSGSESDIAEAKIETEVCPGYWSGSWNELSLTGWQVLETLQAALK